MNRRDAKSAKNKNGIAAREGQVALYDSDAPITSEFFATVQNKLHWAITGKTAAEIVHDSADVSMPCGQRFHPQRGGFPGAQIVRTPGRRRILAGIAEQEQTVAPQKMAPTVPA